MRESLKRIEPEDLAAGLLGSLKPDATLHKIERRKDEQHAEDSDGPDPRQPAFMKTAPIASLWLFENCGLVIRDGDAPSDLWSLFEEQIFVDRIGCRVGAARVLRAHGRAQSTDHQK